MFICTVVGNVWATRKEESLSGLKLMLVKHVEFAGQNLPDIFVAVDCVGSGTGEKVLVVTGSSARKALKNENSPVDVAIVGIIDEINSQDKE